MRAGARELLERWFQSESYRPERGLSLRDTNSIVASFPILYMKYQEGNDNLDRFDSLIEYSDIDSLSQIAIIKKGKKSFAMVSFWGLHYRWAERERKFSEIRIKPNPAIQIWKDDDKSVRGESFSEAVFGYSRKVFSMENLLEFLKSNPEKRLFSVYEIMGLFCVEDGVLKRLYFDKDKQVGLSDAQEYYEKNILKYGKTCVGNIIVGGGCMEYVFKGKRRMQCLEEW